MKLKRFAALLPILLIAACKPVVLAPSGDVAAQQRDLLVISTVLMLLIIIPVIFLTLYFAWKYRESNKDADYQPDWDHSTKLELVIWAAPLLIIICLGALTWVGTHLLDPYRPLNRISATEQAAPGEEPLVVEVVALDWKWLFIYPEYGVASVNDMAVPVDRAVEFKLTSSTVMNAFYIPTMAGMIYAMPGMETTLHGVINKPGTYDGFSSHYSGAGFSHMRFKAHATDTDGFNAWIAKARESGATLDRPSYIELSQPTENAPVQYWAEVDPELFPRVVQMCVEEGRMCMSEMMALDAQGGTGLAGAINVAQLPRARNVTGTIRPVFGTASFMVTSFCTPEDSARMFASSDTAVTAPFDPSPMRGHALTRPGAPAASGLTALDTETADRNL
ncbi:ubiquinol oxidase subunit II [Frigidibacter sp. MR17.24]|uniref:ubiquinol oxidase subunit II n=1 Tax=Frigidibacter sp. MR17.24 TaxID=3127345 RepID=UPI003012AD59